MIRKLFGYLLAGVSFLGIGFFKFYNGPIIPYPFLWFCLSVVVFIIAVFIISNSKPSKTTKQEKYNKSLLSKLKKTGEKIVLTGASCEIKENSYYEEDLNENMTKAQMIDASFDPNRNYSQHYVEQSVIIYFYESSGKKHRLVSPSFPFDSHTLTEYIKNKKVSLYVDRFNVNSYVFELLN